MAGFHTKTFSNHSDYMTPKSAWTPTFIEVCAGGGGLSSGLIKSGFTPMLIKLIY